MVDAHTHPGEDLGNGKLCITVSLTSKAKGLSVTTEHVYELQQYNVLKGSWGSSDE